MVERPTYDELAERLAVAEQTLRAIHEGGVDAVVVSTPDGPRVYTLQGADEFYRALVEQMGEGAAAVQRDGTVLYANTALARLLAVPLQQLTGSNILDHAPGLERPLMASVLASQDPTEGVDLRLGRSGSTAVDVTVSAREVSVADGTHTLCLIVSDRTQHRQAEAAERRAQLLAERERVARDLHDVVIQSLFALGLRLHSFGAELDPEHAARLRLIADALDDTITAIRSTIFRLRNTSPESLRAAIMELVDEAPVVLGFAADLTIEGAVDTLVPVTAHHDIVATLRESLTNVARHAGATRLTIDVVVTPVDVALRVVDNGRGLPERRVESGLANLRARAEALGGTSSAVPNPEGRGTRFEWRIPIDDSVRLVQTATSDSPPPVGPTPSC